MNSSIIATELLIYSGRLTFSVHFNDLIKFRAFVKNFQVKLTLTDWKRKTIVLVTMRHWQFHSI